MVYEGINLNLCTISLPSIDAKKNGRIERNENMGWNFEESKKFMKEFNALSEKAKEEAKQYTEEQMREDIKKYGLDKEFGIYIVDEGERPCTANSGYLIKNKDGTFQVVYTGERAIPTLSFKVNTINEAMSCLVAHLKYEKSKAEYFRNGR